MIQITAQMRVLVAIEPVDEITDLELLDQTFPGGRPTATGKHKWDVLFIRAKPAKNQLHAVPKRNPG